MTTNKMEFKDGNSVMELLPSDGYKGLTNDIVFSNCVLLGKHDDINNWHDTNDEPPAPDEEATIEDYQNSLERLGV